MCAVEAGVVYKAESSYICELLFRITFKAFEVITNLATSKCEGIE